MAKEPILSVKNLEVKFKVRDRVLTAIRPRRLPACWTSIAK